MDLCIGNINGGLQGIGPVKLDIRILGAKGVAIFGGGSLSFKSWCRGLLLGYPEDFLDGRHAVQHFLDSVLA